MWAHRLAEEVAYSYGHPLATGFANKDKFWTFWPQDVGSRLPELDSLTGPNHGKHRTNIADTSTRKTLQLGRKTL